MRTLGLLAQNVRECLKEGWHDMDLFEFISQSELIIFDLDGVILDSNGAKLEIMREVLGLTTSRQQTNS